MSKYTNMISVYIGHDGTRTIDKILGFMDAGGINTVVRSKYSRLRFTGKQLGMIMNSVNAAYNAGKNDAGAELIDNDIVWINGINKGYRLSDIEKLTDIKKGD